MSWLRTQGYGPVADLLRLNTGIPPTPVGSQIRLGFIAGDEAGYPNGRRPVDDVFDISARAVKASSWIPRNTGWRSEMACKPKRKASTIPSPTSCQPIMDATVPTPDLARQAAPDNPAASAP